MKKTLAIVLALAMVLCMIPAAFAATTETITDKSYNLAVKVVGADENLNTASKANSITAGYKYGDFTAVETGKFSEKKVMALVTVDGFVKGLSDTTTTIDGKKLDVTAPGYGAQCKYDDGKVIFPVELTKAGYTDSFVITVTGKKNAGAPDEVVVTETAKISVTLKNTTEYKTAKTATVTRIESSDTKIMDAYIVGSKIYFDWASDAEHYNNWANETVKVTFADENGAAFKEITWAYDARANGAIYLQPVGSTTTTLAGKSRLGAKLSDSAVSFNIHTAIDGKKFKFELETANAIYETKEYTAVVRSNVAAVDPKGIYFAESTKTIKVGESYAPVVMGVATGKAITADHINYGTNTSKEVIEIDNKKVIGTKEGVAYITADYQPFNGTKYESSSMKIIVAGEAEAVTGTTTYYVTCRNLNVRKGAGTSYAKAGMLHRGDKVEVVSISKNWAKLANGTYVSAKYIAK